MGAVIAVVSGKGGTGKSTTAAALACCLAHMGRRVLAVDADAELRNLDLYLGLSDRAVLDYGDVLAGRCPPDRALTPSPVYPGLSLLAAPLEPVGGGLGGLIRALSGGFDYCLVDCPGGLGPGFREAAAAADRALVVSGTDPCSHRDAGRAAQALRDLGVADARLIVNRVSRRFLRAADATLDDSIDRVGLRLIGYVPEDGRVPLALAAGQPLTAYRGGSWGAAAAFGRIAKRIDGQKAPLV